MYVLMRAAALLQEAQPVAVDHGCRVGSRALRPRAGTDRSGSMNRRRRHSAPPPKQEDST
ncbi:hypothetical protein METUNv1_03318 [Methyloversatilis universalis FAM5]|uniref:Uncharacterized protein n=1 Tax=Methyloversatilis universalis (strain ATCC BAA-1314 / DSM 25237 / JCM 13912 / CCUG 52030 / FAM5) TaxID=1000565 RepID=F5RGM5_METUF|nr:hypothetical protein METUNv1_03318 [Methyloversatilis universalis FAM5]